MIRPSIASQSRKISMALEVGSRGWSGRVLRGRGASLLYIQNVPTIRTQGGLVYRKRMMKRSFLWRRKSSWSRTARWSKMVRKTAELPAIRHSRRVYQILFFGKIPKISLFPVGNDNFCGYIIFRHPSYVMLRKHPQLDTDRRIDPLEGTDLTYPPKISHVAGWTLHHRSLSPLKPLFSPGISYTGG